ANEGFLTISGQPWAPATLAVIVTPQTAPQEGSTALLAPLLVPVAEELAAKSGSTDLGGQLLVPMAEELAATSSATAVTGVSAGSRPGSPITLFRASYS